jgi:hypothetical protein
VATAQVKALRTVIDPSSDRVIMEREPPSSAATRRRPRSPVERSAERSST